MSFENRGLPGWGVRPIGWNHVANEENEKTDEINFEIGMDGKEFAKWVSLKWNLLAFDETKPVTERKQEWERFIEQFNRIVEIRKLSSLQKLQALKIQAGQYLNDIIKTKKDDNNQGYESVLSYLNNYFNQTCDIRQERTKFREMKMRRDESFVDFELKCEKQIKYCNFSKEQAEEELTEALIRRSVLAPTLQSDLFSIIKQGTHLDHMRKEDEENKDPYENVLKPVMHLQRTGNDRLNHRKLQQRFNPYQRKSESDQQNRFSRIQNINSPKRELCGKCSEYHAYNCCPAQNRKCMKCQRWGHYARCCKSPSINNANSNLKETVKSINQTGASNINENVNDPRVVRCSIGSTTYEALIDSGSTVNCYTFGIQRYKTKWLVCS